MDLRSVESVMGAWVGPKFESSLINRCRSNWSVPVGQLSNCALATFVRQRIALQLVVPEAKRRLAAGFTDDTELYPEELQVAVSEAPDA